MLHKRLFVCLASLFLTSSVLHAKVKDGKLKIDDTKKIYSLTGTWKFRPEDKAEFSRLDFDDSGWKMIRVPLSWHQDGIEYDGASWFRMKVLIDGSYKDKGIGVILPYIDASYEFFFNDEIVGRSGEISNSGELIKASSKIEKIIIPRKLVRHGRENLVALRVRSYGGVGGFVTPYAYIGEKTIIHDKYTSYLIWNGILAGILIFVGLNHLMTFIGRLKESHYLFFGLYSISIGFEVIGIKTLGYWIYDSYFFNTYLLNFGLCTFCISLLSFFYSFYQIPKRDFVYISFLSIFGITTISFFLGTFSPQLFYIYAKYFLPAMLLAVILALGYTAYLSFRAVQQRVFGANIIICGFLVTLLTVTNDILSYLELIHSEKYAEEGILIFVVSMAVAVSFKFSHVHKESEILNLDLDEKIRQLENVQEGMQKSEEKYRNLVESSKDIIFSLNGNNEIITINKAIFNLLGLRPDRLIGRNFLELIYKSQTESAISLNKLIVNEKLEETIRKRKEASFRAEFLTNNNEPKELEVKVEYVETDGNEFVLFGKASGVTEDTIMRLCESERQRYVLGNLAILE
ncbi:MAG: PAS domain-containing protein [Leptospira sp.]|nr:PAS domain-containing protein [Leptospira sp.]